MDLAAFRNQRTLAAVPLLRNSNEDAGPRPRKADEARRLCDLEKFLVKYWPDTEFIAQPFTIDLISIGMVAEEGREFYAESNQTEWSKASP